MKIKINKDFELLIIIIVWILLDLIVYIFSGNLNYVELFQAIFVIFILIPYILWRTKRRN
mgnify:FL=1